MQESIGIQTENEKTTNEESSANIISPKKLRFKDKVFEKKSTVFTSGSNTPKAMHDSLMKENNQFPE